MSAADRTADLTRERLHIEAVRCDDCGRIGLTVNHHRITPHKCRGLWTTITSADYQLPPTTGYSPARADGLSKVLGELFGRPAPPSEGANTTQWRISINDRS